MFEAPENPVIANLMATGYPDGKEPIYPRCPICNGLCQTIYRTERGEIVGCDCCLTEHDAWEDVPYYPERD